MANSKAGIIGPIDKCKQRNTRAVYRDALSEIAVSSARNSSLIPERAVRNSQQEVWKRQSRFSPWETAFENAAQKMHEQVEQIPYLRRKDNANTGMDRKR